MANKNSGSKTEFAVRLILVFFISLLSFSVGTFVGKQVSDSDYRRAALEGEFNIHRGTASDETASATSNNELNELSEEEIASLTEEFIESEKNKLDAEEAPAAETTTAAAAPSKLGADGYKKYGDTAQATPGPKVKKQIEERKAEVNNYKDKIAANNPAADKVAKNQAASSGVVEKRNPSSILPSVASSAIGKYTVQIASYAVENEAKSHAAKLKEKGWNAFYIPAEVSGRTWFRVSVGLFNSVESAKNFQGELTKEASISSSIIQKIVQ